MKDKKLKKLVAQFEIQDELILKAVSWGTRFATEVLEAGGDPVSLLTDFSTESVIMMVRNDLMPTYEGE